MAIKANLKRGSLPKRDAQMGASSRVAGTELYLKETKPSSGSGVIRVAFGPHQVCVCVCARASFFLDLKPTHSLFFWGFPSGFPLKPYKKGAGSQQKGPTRYVSPWFLNVSLLGDA